MMIEIDVMEFRVGGGDDSFAKPKKKIEPCSRAKG
jgi:hypothetical protein